MSDEIDYYYNFGLVVVGLCESDDLKITDYQSMIKTYVRGYFKEVMKIPCDFKVSVDYFESGNDYATPSLKMPNEDVVYKEFVIRCKLSIPPHENNKIKIINPSLHQYMRDSESQFMKKFIHII